MESIFNNLSTAFYETSIWEWLGVLSGVLYVIFISYKKMSAWLFACISSLIYIYLCYQSNLYIETGLQFFYLIMGIYGWYAWKKTAVTNAIIIKWPFNYHLTNGIVSSILVFAVGYFFKHYTQQANPYTDAFTTIFSLAATFMVTKKVLENWIYWIIIDAVCIYLFASRGLYLTSLLFFFYTIIAIFGYRKWLKQYQLQ